MQRNAVFAKELAELTDGLQLASKQSAERELSPVLESKSVEHASEVAASTTALAAALAPLGSSSDAETRTAPSTPATAIGRTLGVLDLLLPAEEAGEIAKR